MVELGFQVWCGVKFSFIVIFKSRFVAWIRCCSCSSQENYMSSGFFTALRLRRSHQDFDGRTPESKLFVDAVALMLLEKDDQDMHG